MNTDFERKEQRAGITSGRRGTQKRYRVFWPLTSTLSRRQMTPKYMNADLIAYTYELLDISFFSFLLQYKSFLNHSGL
jgi:hypothetical protein